MYASLVYVCAFEPFLCTCLLLCCLSAVSVSVCIGAWILLVDYHVLQIEQNSKAEAQKFLANGEVSAAIEADAQGRRARGKILYAKSAARKVVKMEERLRTMQKYRVGQEMLEDGVGPLVRRIEQLHRLVCKTGSPTAQFVIRGSVTFLQDQLKRQSRKLHWDMKRSEQHEIVEESMRELEAEAALALKVCHKALPMSLALSSFPFINS